MKNNVFVISDLHFGHANIIKIANRPYKNVNEMDEDLIKRWNSVAKSDDTIYIIGDFALKVKKYISKLNGKKILITGNHDKLEQDDYSYFEKVYRNYHECTINNQKYVMCHYPMISWNGMFRNSILLYGHIHNSHKPFEKVNLPNAFCVNCEMNNYTPINIKFFENNKQNFGDWIENRNN